MCTKPISSKRIILILISYIFHVLGTTGLRSTPSLVSSEVTRAVVTDDKKDGPFCTLYTDFFREVYKKSKLILSNIFQFTTRAVEKLNSQSAFSWLGELEHFTMEVIKREFQEKPSAKIKVHARMLHDRMLTRTKHYNVEVNQVLDYLNDFFTVKDIKRGNQAISDFHAYPRVNKTPLMLCCDVLNAFNEPFRGGKKDPSFRNMLILSQKILKKEYPNLFMEDVNEDYGTVKFIISLFLM